MHRPIAQSPGGPSRHLSSPPLSPAAHTLGTAKGRVWVSGSHRGQDLPPASVPHLVAPEGTSQSQAEPG